MGGATFVSLLGIILPVHLTVINYKIFGKGLNKEDFLKPYWRILSGNLSELVGEKSKMWIINGGIRVHRG